MTPFYIKVKMSRSDAIFGDTMQLQFLKIDEKKGLLVLKSRIKEWVSSVHCFLISMDMECSTVGVGPGGQDH